MANDPIKQFQITEYFTFGSIGGVDLSMTNSAVFMILTTASVCGFLMWSTGSRGLIPSRMQSVAEILYDFVANMLRDSAGREGMKFFPFVFSLFMFILFANLFGMFPYFFTVTSHIIVTFALALLVISTVIIYG
ncbi:MAG: FoF1 ATP synthase subunit a, partial [Pseudomonadota bacterium]